MTSQQTRSIVLIEPNYAHSTPVFHVERSLAPAFLDFLTLQGFVFWRQPRILPQAGPDGRDLGEIEIHSGTPLKTLEKIMLQFFRQENLT